MLFNPTVALFPPLGLGETGSKRLVPVEAPKEPRDDLLAAPKPLLPLEANGLPVGEYGDPEPPSLLLLPWTSGLPLPDRGELAKLPLLPTEPDIEGVRE